MWRDLFETSLDSPEEREYGEEFIFGAPATPKDIQRAEKELGVQLPEDLRTMYLEFNGIKMKEDPDFPDDLDFVLFPMQELLPQNNAVRSHYAARPIASQLKSVLFFCGFNGCSDCCGICLQDFDDFSEGDVVELDHELAWESGLQRYPYAKDLAGYLRRIGWKFGWDVSGFARECDEREGQANDDRE